MKMESAAQVHARLMGPVRHEPSEHDRTVRAPKNVPMGPRVDHFKSPYTSVRPWARSKRYWQVGDEDNGFD